LLSEDTEEEKTLKKKSTSPVQNGRDAGKNCKAGIFIQVRNI
jgi:hypothetical protein